MKKLLFSLAAIVSVAQPNLWGMENINPADLFTSDKFDINELLVNYFTKSSSPKSIDKITTITNMLKMFPKKYQHAQYLLLAIPLYAMYLHQTVDQSNSKGFLEEGLKAIPGGSYIIENTGLQKIFDGYNTASKSLLPLCCAHMTCDILAPSKFKPVGFSWNARMVIWLFTLYKMRDLINTDESNYLRNLTNKLMGNIEEIKGTQTQHTNLLTSHSEMLNVIDGKIVKVESNTNKIINTQTEHTKLLHETKEQQRQAIIKINNEETLLNELLQMFNELYDEVGEGTNKIMGSIVEFKEETSKNFDQSNENFKKIELTQENMKSSLDTLTNMSGIHQGSINDLKKSANTTEQNTQQILEVITFLRNNNNK